MIHVEHLCKRFGAVIAVDDLSFDVERGETFAIIGPNGAGKTTTLKVLLGLTLPDSGVVGIGPERLECHAYHHPGVERGLRRRRSRLRTTPTRFRACHGVRIHSASASPLER